MAERSSALDSSSGVVRMWVRIPAWPVAALVSLSKTLNHNCFILRMGRKAVGPVCCVMHIKNETPGFAPVFLDSRLKHPAGWICARYKSSVLLLLLLFLLRTIRAYWSKRRVVPPVLFRTNYYSIEILHGVTAIILTYHPHHAKLQVLPIIIIIIIMCVANILDYTIS